MILTKVRKNITERVLIMTSNILKVNENIASFVNKIVEYCCLELYYNHYFYSSMSVMLIYI